MNVGELKAYLQMVPDDIKVVTASSDHSYFLAGEDVTLTTGLNFGMGIVICGLVC